MKISISIKRKVLGRFKNGSIKQSQIDRMALDQKWKVNLISVPYWPLPD